MRKKILSLLAILAIVAGNANAQLRTNESGVLNGVYQKHHTAKKMPIPFEYLREADVMWSKTIWRKIDLFEKINLQLYFPEKPIMERMSMIDLLLDGIKNSNLTVYAANPSDVNEFKDQITYAEIETRLGGGNDTIMVPDQDGNLTQQIIPREINTKEIKTYMVKEVWFFDKQRSVLDVRIIGICPIRTYYKAEDLDQEDPKYRQLFWVHYGDVRNLFATHEVFNERNEAESRSYDDIFMKRYFSSYITREANTYENRDIAEYSVGLETQLESERIKNNIFNMEQDLWEY